MIVLVSGLALFAGVHLVPSLAPGLKQRWHARLGENGYKGSFSLLLVASFALMIMGWRGTEPSFVYMPVAALHSPALGLLVIAFALFVVSNRPSRLCLVVRHPQLTGVALWGCAHLLLNGDSRSLVLFGTMSVWAVVEMIAINRRDGLWIKGEAPSWASELLTLVITAIVVGVLVFVHPWLAGMPVS